MTVAELGHVADLLRADPAALDWGVLAGLAGRLPLLAGTLDVVTRRLVRHGALLSKHIRIDPSVRRAGVAPATGQWTTAKLETPAVIALLAGLEHAAADQSDHAIRSRAGRRSRPSTRCRDSRAAQQTPRLRHRSGLDTDSGAPTAGPRTED